MIQPAARGRSRASRRAVAALLIVAVLGTLWVPLYARDAPKLGPFPFFYWFQFVWVLVSPALCWLAYLLLKTRPAAGRDQGAHG